MSNPQDYVDYVNAENNYYDSVYGGSLPTNLTPDQVTVGNNGFQWGNGDNIYIDAAGSSGKTLNWSTGKGTMGGEVYDPSKDYAAAAADYNARAKSTSPVSVGGDANATPGGGGGASSGGVSAGQLAGLSGDQRNAYTALMSVFSQYGLESLAPKILGFVKQGYDSSTTSYLLQQTPEYQQRFAGNQERLKSGLAALSPAEYLATERAYKDAAQAYGLPSGFYDQPSDFADLIGKDISPTEFSTRASYAFKYAQNTNPEARAALQMYYGVDDQHLAAYFLDPQKAQAVIDRQALAADIGGAGLRQGIGVTKGLAERYADLGVTQGQADAGFGKADEALLSGQMNIASRYGSDLTTTDLADEFVTGLASAKRKRELLNQQEQAQFQQGADSARASFGIDNVGSY